MSTSTASDGVEISQKMPDKTPFDIVSKTQNRLTLPGAPPGASGYQCNLDTFQFRVTNPPEDRSCCELNDHKTRAIIGVFDGHGGSENAELVSQKLPKALLKQPPSEHGAIFQKVDDAIISAFTNDHSLLGVKSRNWQAHARAARAGCMALVLDLDFLTGMATISNAGDCRLVVFRRAQGTGHAHSPIPHGTPPRFSNDLTVVYSTKDLNSKTRSERDRLKSEHPGEDQIIVGDRLFGKLMSTRGFGDAYYKIPIDGFLGRYHHKRYIDALSAAEHPGKVPMNQQYESLFYGYKSPPYITARPETDTIQLLCDDVVLMASDGLWDRFPKEQAAEIVNEVLAAHEPGVNIANSLLQKVFEDGIPGDDTTILVLRIVEPCNIEARPKSDPGPAPPCTSVAPSVEAHSPSA